jgi:hypothetical protein
MSSDSISASSDFSVLRLSPTATHCCDDLRKTDDLRQRFEQKHVLILPDLLDADFIFLLKPLLAGASFVTQPVPQFGERSVEAPPSIIGKAITAAFKRPHVMRFLEDLTRCGPLTGVQGEFASYSPGRAHELSWHDDRNEPGRRLAITVNLSDRHYDGGTFELRKKNSDQIPFRFTHRMVGTALVFRVGHDLEHRVEPVTAGGPRHVYAGWFLGP